MPLEQVLALTEVNREGAFLALGEVPVDLGLLRRCRAVTHVQIHIRVEQTLRGGSRVHTRLQRRERLHEPETARKAVAVLAAPAAAASSVARDLTPAGEGFGREGSAGAASTVPRRSVRQHPERSRSMRSPAVSIHRSRGTLTE